MTVKNIVQPVTFKYSGPSLLHRYHEMFSENECLAELVLFEIRKILCNLPLVLQFPLISRLSKMNATQMKAVLKKMDRMEVRNKK